MSCFNHQCSFTTIYYFFVMFLLNKTVSSKLPSPLLSPSASACSPFGRSGQLSNSSRTPSPSLKTIKQNKTLSVTYWKVVFSGIIRQYTHWTEPPWSEATEEQYWKPKCLFPLAAANKISDHLIHNFKKCELTCYRLLLTYLCLVRHIGHHNRSY